MRVGVHAVGSEGDIRPLVALAAGLRRAGHPVTVAAHGATDHDYATLCRRLDLGYIPSAHSPSLDAARLSATDSASWAIELFDQFWRAGGHEDLIYDTALSLCQRNDVVISHYLSYPTKAAAIATGAPHVSVQLTHEHTPTRHRPPFVTLPNLGPQLNPVMWDTLADMHDGATRHLVERFWTRRQLPPFRRVTDLYFSDRLNLIAVSRFVCQNQPDWNGLHVVIGPLELPAATEGPLSNALRAFLDAGPPPVFTAFGSVQEIYPGSQVASNMELLLDATRAAGCRAVIQVPPSLEPSMTVDATAPQSRDIFLAGRVPYSRMFEASALVVHHGGAGTLHLALRCGRPSVVVPFTDHHLFFAHELHRLGVAPPPVRRSELDAPALAQSIRQVLEDERFACRAREIGRQMEDEDGVAGGVAAIRRCFEQGATG